MSFHYTIEPEWNVLKNIKEAVEADSNILEQGADFLDATRMAALELVENALKYSDRVHPIEISINVDNGECVIQTININTSETSREALVEIMKKIETGDPFELYVDRLQELQEKPDGFSRMGLYRIVYEGEYQLSLELKGERVILTARRKLIS